MMRKKFMKLFAILLVMVLTVTLVPAPARADDSGVKPNRISVSGSSKKTVSVGQEFELKVKVYSGDDDFIQWSIISGKNVIRFADKDRTGDDADFTALKKGTARVRAKIRGTSKKVDFSITVKGASGSITCVGKKTRTVKVGEDFELKVKASKGVSDRKLKWKIKNTKIVNFEDKEDKRGDDAEFVALKKGSTTITCTNTATKKSVIFTIKVKKGNGAKISAKGSTKRVVEVGDDFELKVTKTGKIADRFLKWSIEKTDIVTFDDEDDDRGDDAEFYAAESGTTKISCTNTLSNKSVTFTVTVLDENEDDLDDDYDDDDDDYYDDDDDDYDDEDYDD